ncbi:peptidylprolyl isomerase [Brevundimonas sp. S30B]|nr:peptidylprolyl isomerase [Brevundimonas sp. MF30-B]TFW04607.1 peptidylprolyl isomerase [Brevundimonas sp. S30B]
MLSTALAALALSLAVAPIASAQASRTVEPQNLMVIDTAKGRILVELSPTAAPAHVERLRTLAGQGFYDGLKFHRVIPNFMAQTGDPLGTGAGGSELPNLRAEFSFRRGREGFVEVPNAGQGVFGLVDALPVQTQPDAQMMINADFKVAANGLFCPGVLGMARSGSPDSANSQFFLMSGRNANLDGLYTAFGRVLSGLDVVRALKPGSEAEDGRVIDPDVMSRVRMASDLPDGERPQVTVTTPTVEMIEAERARRGAVFSVCDIQPVVEVAG